VPEVIDDGVTGFVVSTIEEAVKAVSTLNLLNRKKIREVFEARFTSEIMAKIMYGFTRSSSVKTPQVKNIRKT